MSKENFKITVLAETSERCEKVGEMLRENYEVVINSGIHLNTRPPNLGKWRGYYTIVIDEPDEDEGMVE